MLFPFTVAVTVTGLSVPVPVPVLLPTKYLPFTGVYLAKGNNLVSVVLYVIIPTLLSLFVVNIVFIIELTASINLPTLLSDNLPALFILLEKSNTNTTSIGTSTCTAVVVVTLTSPLISCTNVLSIEIL